MPHARGLGRGLIVAGTGPDLPYWRRRVAESRLENDIRLLGFTREIPILLAAVDAFVSPTRFEPYGQGVHEALCCGLPAFVTRCAGIAERLPASYTTCFSTTLQTRNSFVSGYLLGIITGQATGR